MKNKNELLVNVKESFSLTTDLIKEEMRVSSLNIAIDFDKTHNKVLRDIKKMCPKLAGTIFGELFKESFYFDDYGRKQKHYMMNRDGFSLLVMGFTGEKALQWKLDYIKWFNFLEREFIVRKETRAKGITIRKTLTESISLNIDEGTNFKKFAYSNYSKLIYKKVLGKDVKKLKEDRGLNVTDNLRDYLTLEELQEVQNAESKIAMWIEAWKDLDLTDKEIYNKIKEKL